MIGYILVGTFHGSLQAQQNGTLALHFTGATLAIVGGNVLALVLGIHWRKTPETRLIGLVSIIVGAFGLVSVIALFLTFDAGLPSGAIERGSVYTIVIWQLAVAVALLRSRANSARPTSPRPVNPQTGIHKQLTRQLHNPNRPPGTSPSSKTPSPPVNRPRFPDARIAVHQRVAPYGVEREAGHRCFEHRAELEVGESGLVEEGAAWVRSTLMLSPMSGACEGAGHGVSFSNPGIGIGQSLRGSPNPSAGTGHRSPPCPTRQPIATIT